MAAVHEYYIWGWNGVVPAGLYSYMYKPIATPVYHCSRSIGDIRPVARIF